MYHCKCGYKFKKTFTKQEKYNNWTGKRSNKVICPQCGRRLNSSARY